AGQRGGARPPARDRAQGCARADRGVAAAAAGAARAARARARAAATAEMNPEKITELDLETAIVVSVAGRVDMRGELQGRVTRLMPLAAKNGKAVVFDFSDWEYCDTGWGAIMVAAKKAKAAGVAIAAVTPLQRAMKERFEMTKYNW